MLGNDVSASEKANCVKIRMLRVNELTYMKR